jgi:high frequency lysogenization protein
MLVHRTANGLLTDARDVAPLLHSVFVTEPESVEAIYGKGARLQLGAATAIDVLGRPDAAIVPVLRYVMALLDIAALLRRRDDLSSALRHAIDALQERAGDEPEALFEPLAAVYQQSVSKLQKRIQVVGVGELLQRNDVAAKVRTLLLAGVRSAWLWYQLGGRRWHLLLRRTTMRRALRDLIEPRMLH